MSFVPDSVIRSANFAQSQPCTTYTERESDGIVHLGRTVLENSRLTALPITVRLTA
jgi:hypothetical protein